MLINVIMVYLINTKPFQGRLYENKFFEECISVKRKSHENKLKLEMIKNPLRHNAKLNKIIKYCDIYNLINIDIFVWTTSKAPLYSNFQVSFLRYMDFGNAKVYTYPRT